MTGYVTNIERDAIDNSDFRRVLFTGPNTQLVLMALRPGDEIGLEAVPVPAGRERDMVGRDACRTPMVWRDEDGAGFTEPGVDS